MDEERIYVVAVFGGWQLLFQSDLNGLICILVGKVVDDVLVPGKPDLVETFLTELDSNWDRLISRTHIHYWAVVYNAQAVDQ